MSIRGLLSALLPALVWAWALPSLAAPVLLEPGWGLVRSDSLADAQSARFNPFDGRLYAVSLRTDTSGGGLYRIEADGSTTLLTPSFRPRGVLVDPRDGDIFVAEARDGLIWRTPFGATGRSLWVSGFGDPEAIPDDDPIGMAMAPPSYTGGVLAPGQALVADEGTSGPKDVFVWDPESPEGETYAHADDGSLLKPVDLTVSNDAVYVIDQLTAMIVRLEPDGSLTPIPTSIPLATPNSIRWDPATGDLLLLDPGTGELLRVDPASGSTTVLANNLVLSPWSDASGIDVSPDGTRLVVTDRGTHEIHTLDLPPAGALSMTCGATLAADFAAVGETDAYHFDARAGDVVGFAASARNGSAVAPRTTLYAPDGSPVAVDDGLGAPYGGCPGWCRSDPLPADGTYELRVFEDGFDAAGDYRLAFEALSGHIAGAATGPPALACGANGAVTISCGETRSGVFDVEGDVDVWTPLAEAGDTLRITVAASGGSGVLPRARLYARDGSAVALGGVTTGCSGVCVSDPLPLDGSYMLVVHDALLAATGAYDLTLEELVLGVPLCQNACNDGVDNDGDGKIDAGVDDGCSGPFDYSELPICADGIDNDNDGFLDGDDPGCQGLNAGGNESPACNDFLDNDNDGKVDLADPECTLASNTKEGKACGIGFELVVLLPPIMALRARRQKSRGRA